MTRLVCISDTHTHHSKLVLPDGDILVHSGDFSKTGRVREMIPFFKWFASQPHKHKVLVAGNHDLTLDEDHYKYEWRRWHPVPEDDVSIRAYLAREEGITYLLDREVNLDGVRIYGSPWQPAFGGWGFNLDRGSNELKRVWANIPEGLDVLVTHGPPYGIRDQLDTGEAVGCGDLLEAVERTVPRVHVFGHIHEGYGITEGGVTTFINAASCDGCYRLANAPLVYDLKSK